ncbi:hypothetical protein PHMEG_0002483 [Phytophthora megakarya]|uniref:Uncharacterized protein n=1 Tax=Phytophthora megakarya TaxID=4795 RepID=A0A225WY69_9STRA|nr:hypothetical protein PHMEG_0002483 [Phytophthora megakarya]
MKMVLSDRGTHSLNKMAQHLSVKLMVELDCTPVFTSASSELEAIVVPTSSARREQVIDREDIGEFVAHSINLIRYISESNRWKTTQMLRGMSAQRGSSPNFDIDRPAITHHNLLDHWVSSFKTIVALSHTFDIEPLVTGRKYKVHSS